MGSSFLEKDCLKYIDIINIILIGIVFIIGGYLTYNPIEYFIFWDPQHETYERVFKLK